MSIQNLMDRYSLAARAAGLSERTVVHNRGAVGYLAAFLGGISDVRKVTADDLRHFIVHLRGQTKWRGTPQANGQKLSDTTINTYVRAIKIVWNWLEKEGLIKTNPLATVPTPRLPKTLPKILSEGEIGQCLQNRGQKSP
ncbi:tyrosine-type recombinase/integrase [Chloroflexota bacterium]